MKLHDSPSRSRASLVEEVARQLLFDLEALQTPLPGGGLQQASSSASSPGQGQGVEPFSLDGPRTVLEGGARYVAPFLPADARFRAAKSLILRSLRIITRDQSVFNSAVTEALRIALKEIEDGVRRSREREAADAGSLSEKLRSLEGLGSESKTRIDELASSVSGRGAEVDRLLAELASGLERANAAITSEARNRETTAEGLERQLQELEERRGRFVRELQAALGRIENELENEGRARNALAKDYEQRIAHQDLLRNTLATELAGALEREARSREMVATEMERRLEHQERMRSALAAEIQGVMKGEEKARELVGLELSRALARLDRLERESDRHEDVTKALRVEGDEASRRFGLLSKRVEELAEEARLSRLEWTALRSSLRGLKGGEAQPGERVSVPQPQAPSASPAPLAPASSPLDAGIYAGFEERFRGREEVIRERQMRDARLFVGAPGLVADLGCGRGEFLEALRQLGVAGEGCDTNAVAVARARQKNLAVAEEDLFAWLVRQPDESLGGITAFQVVEHLASADLLRLVELASMKLARGGRILLETVNPESVFAMKWFWMDLTHVRPVPGGSLAQLLSASGFRNVRLDYRSPVPADAAPPAEVFQDPRLSKMAELLFAAQDVAAIGEK
ncbi:MAG: methyltransferase domain-containing protein [Acidobacteria bacterium]|nr:methyltransferase domain-containing protein [Acidobacteriota bacterium]